MKLLLYMLIPSLLFGQAVTIDSLIPASTFLQVPEDFVDGYTTMYMEKMLKDNKCNSIRSFMEAMVRNDRNDYLSEYFKWYYNEGF